jgi:hypothetical protein
MKRLLVVVFAAILIGCGGETTPVIKVENLWTEREKSKADFQKKYAGKEIVVAGVLRGGKRDFDASAASYEEISIYGDSFHLVHCQNDGKDVAAFKNLPADGSGVAVKGKLVSAEDDAYPAP